MAHRDSDGTRAVTIRFDDIGNRLRAFRLGSGLSAEEVASALGISRTALYRFEKGEITKIETLDKSSELLGVSVATLLGVGVEYISSAVSYFERIRQIEEHAEQIVVLAGPISYLLATPGFDNTLDRVLRESIPPRVDDHDAAMSAIDEVMSVLRARRETYVSRRPSMVNLISAREMQEFLRDGLIGRSDLPSEVLADRRAKAAIEVEHLVELMESQPMGVQIGVVVDTLPHVGFQIFGQPGRKVLTISPFRLGSQPNVRVGVAMVTSAPEPLELHQKMVEDLWQDAHKGPDGAKLLREMMRERSEGPG